MDLNLLLHYGSLFPARVAQLLLEIDMAVYPPSILFSTTHDCAWFRVPCRRDRGPLIVGFGCAIFGMFDGAYSQRLLPTFTIFEHDSIDYIRTAFRAA